MFMQKIEISCSICNSDINKSNFYITGDNSIYFCCEKCMKTFLDNADEFNGIYNIKRCTGYNYCEKLGNIHENCIFKRKITKDLYDPLRKPEKSDFPNWCSPAEISMIVSNMNLLDFVEKSEKESTELNTKTLEQNKLTNKLTWIMLIVSVANLISTILSIIYK